LPRRAAGGGAGGGVGAGAGVLGSLGNLVDEFRANTTADKPGLGLPEELTCLPRTARPPIETLREKQLQVERGQRLKRPTLPKCEPMEFLPVVRGSKASSSNDEPPAKEDRYQGFPFFIACHVMWGLTLCSLVLEFDPGAGADTPVQPAEGQPLRFFAFGTYWAYHSTLISIATDVALKGLSATSVAIEYDRLFRSRMSQDFGYGKFGLSGLRELLEKDVDRDVLSQAKDNVRSGLQAGEPHADQKGKKGKATWPDAPGGPPHADQKGKKGKAPWPDSPGGKGKGGPQLGSLCPHFERNQCTYGDRCSMLHPGVATAGAPWGAKLQVRP